jgi:hypothetical protein
VVGSTDSEANEIVAVSLGPALDECLLKAIGQHHDPTLSKELSPDLLPLRPGQQATLRIRDELCAGELAEIQVVLGVPEPDGDRDGTSLGEQFG